MLISTHGRLSTHSSRSLLSIADAQRNVSTGGPTANMSCRSDLTNVKHGAIPV
jgi:hypothetical protein